MRPILFLLFSLVMISVNAQTILLSEDFEGGDLPAGWTQNTNATDGGWLLGVHTDLESEYWSIAPHGNIIATNDDACDCDKSLDYLIMPPLDLSNSEVVVLQFANYYDGGSLFGGTEVATMEYSLDNGSTWTVLEEIIGTEDDAWDIQTVDLSDLAGNANVLVAYHYNDDANWLFGWAIDDVMVFEPAGFDAALTTLNMPTNINAPSTISVEGTVASVGLETITSFDVTWTIGTDIYTSNFSGLSIEALGNTDFSHPDLLTIDQSGQYALEVSISNINGTADDINIDNNSLSLSLQALEYGEMQVDGFDREYIYYHPTSAPENAPLVFVCHGYTGTAEGIMDYSNFNALADEYGFAVCYPQGIEDSFGNTFFNVGYDFQNNETVDDVAFVEHLAGYFQENNGIDPDKIFCTGLSNGGDFCYLLACEASETFRAVAPIAGMIRQEILDACNPTDEVSIFEIHGTNDDVTYYEGDPNNEDDWGAYPSLPETIEFFADLFEIPLISTENLPDIAPDDGSTVIAEKYADENHCTEIWFYTVEGGGHDWPGAWGNMDINTSLEVWQFFEHLCTETVSTNTLLNTEKTLMKVYDVLGRATLVLPNQVLFYQYSDGSVEKRMILKE